ncbi:MAG: DUF2860 domain-containing protein [Gammaproteobacteria bacterium]|nr:DUF2860 domain-containing protein [Gammaproteobacteria bacterium]MCP4089092.1 DUF2860 domain-containing protein [Gammaproteobacteria bacterium]MCP4276883.1 DUF2860 domain-containing protein [Gammaproteobacteria bacterium]MCP4830726.1 DUF2860 domain-containing protein [Gammaproteobacteria bacterium]MCP4928850.1 DUF2860 domain-containing protein [Gammaproteobacteria bacterium]
MNFFSAQFSHKKKGLLTLTSLLLSASSFAIIPEVSEEKGWAGFVAGGIGWADITSNTVAGNKFFDLGRAPWDGTNTKANSRSKTHGIVGGQVTWTLSGRNALFFGTSLIDELTQSGVMQLGWRKSTHSVGTFQIGILKDPAPIPSRIYTDPFANNSGPRSETDQNSAGIRLGWDRIFNTAFEVTLTALNYDIDSERSGQGYTGLGGCDAACIALLDREGDLTQFEVGYLFKFGNNKHLLRPGVTFSDFDADGNANDYDSTVAKVTYSWHGLENYTFVSNVSFGEQDFDTVNPLAVFGGQEQDTDIFVIDASVIYNLPFGNKNRWQLVTHALYGEGDSDINFYDTEATQVSATVLYHFGNRNNL